MNIQKLNHTAKMVRGDTESLTVTILNGYEPSVNDTITMTVRKTPTAPIEFQVSTSTITLVGTSYSGVLYISHADTLDMAFGKYVYDIQLTSGSSIKTLVPCSVFELVPEVTY